MQRMVRDIAGLQAQIDAVATRIEDARPKTDTDRLRRRKLLHVAIADTFNVSEMNVLAGELGIRDGDIDGQMHEERALNLALYMQRHGRFHELIETLKQKRPSVQWSNFV